mmetsp:Transcript_68174/g.112146  ORF Transcript_68174/g.112146 Transcript_68174/m.112146 type:complete len:292 (+) Transcript_68174:498-1373(+)
MLTAEGSLGLLNFTSEFLNSSVVLSHIFSSLFLVQFDEMCHDILIKIFTTKMGVTICCDYFKDAIVNGEKGDIKGSTTKVKHQDILLSFLLIQTISNSSSSRLIDDTHYSETRNSSSIFCGLTLSIVEVGRYRDDSMCDFLPKIGLGNFPHFTQNHGADLFSSKSLVFSFHVYTNMGLLVLFDYLKGKKLQILLNRFIVPCSTNQAFGIKNSVFWIRGQLILCSITNQSFSFWSESHVRWSDSVSLVVCDDFNSSILENTNTRIRRSKIDTDYSSYIFFISFFIFLVFTTN